MSIPRPFSFIVLGQSYGDAGYRLQSSYYAFMAAIRTAIDSASATVGTTLGKTVAAGDMAQVRNKAVGGTAILQAYDNGNGYWVGNDLTTAGARLTDALTAIAEYSDKPAFVLYSHGEQDAQLIASEAASANVRTALENVLIAQVRSAINSGSPTSVPWFVDMLGPRYSGNELAEYWIRDRLIETIEAGTRIYRGAEKYALQLDNTTHPTDQVTGYMQMGAHAGRKVAAWLLNPSVAPAGPTIASAVKTGSNVAVTITVPSGATLVKPTLPEYFGLFDAAEKRIPILSYSWSGNVLTLVGKSAATKFRYPARPTSGKKLVDITRVVRLADPSSPIYAGEPGLVLESTKTITL